MWNDTQNGIKMMIMVMAIGAGVGALVVKTVSHGDAQLTTDI